MSDFTAIKEAACSANIALGESGLVIATFGNVSAFDQKSGVFAIKPSGVPYEELTPDAMVVVDLDNNIIEGTLRPSSDTKTHSVLFRAFPGIGGICHTHSPYAVAWAQAKRSIPVLGTTHADHLAYPVPCTEEMSDQKIQGDYETETGNQIVEHFKTLDYHEIEMVLVACHGPFTWGKNAEKALYNSVILEEISKMALFTGQLSPSVKPLKDALIEKHYNRKHGKGAYYGQS